MYLVDTNVWLERLLAQQRAAEVARFLNDTPSENLWITDFSFHSIGVLLTRLKQGDALVAFARDLFVDGAGVLCSLDPEDTARIVAAVTTLSLDFDDAYQYVAAEKHHLTLVSFDAHFDATPRGRKTPAQVLAGD